MEKDPKLAGSENSCRSSKKNKRSLPRSNFVFFASIIIITDKHYRLIKKAWWFLVLLCSDELKILKTRHVASDTTTLSMIYILKTHGGLISFLGTLVTYACSFMISALFLSLINHFDGETVPVTSLPLGLKSVSIVIIRYKTYRFKILKHRYSWRVFIYR